MSESDTFIEEVSEEVRRDRLFALMRKWGWVPILAILLLVGGAAYSEWQKSQATAQAQDLGDAMLAALEEDDSEARIVALGAVNSESAGGQAVVAFLQSAEQLRSGDSAAAAQTLESIVGNTELPLIYRQIASFKSFSIRGAKTTDERRAGFGGLAVPGAPLRLMAEEQLALIDLEEGNGAAGLERLQRIIVDAEITAGLRRRVVQVIVALGAEPETAGNEALLGASE